MPRTADPTRKQSADAVLAHLRDAGPRTVDELQADLAMTKRQVQDALYLLGNRQEVEYVWPTTAPLTYKACA